MKNSNLNSTLPYVFALFLTAPVIFNCSSTEVTESNSAEAAFKAAEDYEKDERFEEALAKFGEVKNKHPYSRFAIESELHICDIHFKRENFIESQTCYQLFKDFHPKHSRIDYVTYKLASSYFYQLPPTIDRDLSPSFKAIQFYDEVISSFSSSEFVKEAKEKKDGCLKMLAEKELYIGQFYFKREMYDSALKRFEGLLQKYSGRGFDEEALFKAGVSAYESGEKEKGAVFLKKLETNHPQGEWASKAKNAREEYGRR